MYQFLLVMVMGLALVGGQIPNLGWCPDYVPMADFEMDKYLGTWYEQERYFRVMEAGSRCVRTNYTKAVDGRILVASEITGRLTGLKRVIEGEMLKGSEPRISIKYQVLPFPVEMSYTVLDTDYDTYSVVWSCSGLGPVNTQSAWVMTRERLAPGTVLQKAYGVLDKYKISRTFFVKTDQADCAIAEAAAANKEQENKVTTTGKSAEHIEEPDDKKHPEANIHSEVVKPEVEKPSSSVSSDDVHIPVVVDSKPHHEHHIKPHVAETTAKHSSPKVH
ncbi:apolipoprotein D-like isoform X2 [Lycorma delicatula]|uniref:apolipoprotein D-like isoform X2 n=1 Tax=Lycorma delicatula TaxID=130591 RepID=UPI003F50F61A